MFVHTRDGTQGTILVCYVTGVDEVELTFADEVWNSVQYSCCKFCVDGVKLVQIRSGT